LGEGFAGGGAAGVHDLIIVGSGPAGFAAAMANPGQDVLVVDPGFEPAPPEAERLSLLEAKRTGSVRADAVIGARYESLHNVHGDYLSPKLKAPLMRFITRGADEWTPLRSSSFLASLSLARGGLANAWGAGAFRYSAQELARFPFAPGELAPHYRALIEHIGVTGSNDDLEHTFGSAAGHLPPPEPNRAGRDLFARYAKSRAWLNRRGLRIGRPRLALLSREHRGRPSYRHDGLELFRPHDASIFNPGQALLGLVEEGRVQYRPGVVVERFEAGVHGVSVHGRAVPSGTPVTLGARRLALAAGALNSARIVLASARDHRRRLPVRDNLVSFVPLLDPRCIGAALDEDCLPAQAVLVLDGPGAREAVQMTFYGVGAMLWGDVAFELPVPAPGLPAAVRALMPALRMLQIFYPDVGPALGHCSLARDGALEIEYAAPPRGAHERRAIDLMRRLGYLGHSSFCRYPPPGSCFHYAGTLPMQRKPGAFETAPDGSLAGCPRVFVVDAATFPELPSKNLTLTIMANSRRIAAGIYSREAP
jgi:choline dehydrogenase-like flavoprotein